MIQLLILASLTIPSSALPVGPIGAPCFANESASELFTDVDLSGKIAVVTGSDEGIGFEVARALAARQATVVMPGRNSSKMKAAAARIENSIVGAKVVVPSELLDLSSFSMVRDSAIGLKRFPAIHILVNNAGVASTSHPISTNDGMDLVFETDYVSQWLFTSLLLPQLRLGRGRIVNVASKAASLACEMSMRWDCTNLKRLPPPPTSGHVPLVGLPRSNYGIAKMLMVWWTEDLARREVAAGSGVSAFSLHPGFVNTSMASSASKTFSWLACQSDGRQGAPCPTTPPIGALTPTFLALAPGIENSTGSYFEWCAKTKLPVGSSTQDFKDGLWKLTAKWVSNFSHPLIGIHETSFV